MINVGLIVFLFGPCPLKALRDWTGSLSF